VAHLGWGAAEEGVQGLRWSDRPDDRCPGPVDVVRSCHGRCPRTTGALVPVLPRPGVLDDEAMASLRRLRRGVRRPPSDEAVRPLPGGASTRCATSAAYNAQVSYHLPVLIILHYKYSVANNFMFHLCGDVVRRQVAAVRGRVGVHNARAERRHRAPPSRWRRLGSVPSVVPPRMQTRVTYVPATPPPPPVPDHDGILPDATYPVRRDQTADTAVSYDTANIYYIHMTFHYNMCF
jgi:hypothetical protein